MALERARLFPSITCLAMGFISGAVRCRVAGMYHCAKTASRKERDVSTRRIFSFGIVEWAVESANFRNWGIDSSRKLMYISI